MAKGTGVMQKGHSYGSPPKWVEGGFLVKEKG